MLSPRWSHDPLSGRGAARAGGRWNAPDCPALYLSRDHGTAIAEYQQDLPRPGTLTAYDVAGAGILDLTLPETRAALEVADKLLREPWKQARDIEHRRPECWDFADAAIAAGWNGLLVPSVQAVGINLVLWHYNEATTPRVRYLDPQRDLSRDQSSWRVPTAEAPS
jgi:RES domain-containing protein